VSDKKFNFVLIGFNKLTSHLSEEINTFALLDYECDGVEEFSLEESRVDEILGERAYSGGDVPETLIDEVQEATSGQESFTFKYFFYQGDFESNSSEFVNFIKENYPELSVLTGQRNFEDWNAEWKKFYNPIYVSNKIEIIPEWLQESHINKSENQVYIYPGMGFGTGTHETTYLCLVLYSQVMEQLSKQEMCLDFGCGSGILGITAMKTKQMTTHFCDIDKSALDNCTQNIVLNFNGQDLTGTELFIRERYNLKKYDLVFANILEHVLVLEKEIITHSVNTNGFVIMSGLLNHQVDNMIQTYDMLERVNVVTKGDWSAILFRKKA
jgi:ribosomal protein L11 methyltransferase